MDEKGSRTPLLPSPLATLPCDSPPFLLLLLFLPPSLSQGLITTAPSEVCLRLPWTLLKPKELGGSGAKSLIKTSFCLCLVFLTPDTTRGTLY